MVGFENSNLSRWGGTLITLLVVALIATGCTPGSQPDGNRLLVVATTSIIGDIASNVVGDAGDVEVLIPIGADAHDFSPSAQQASRIAAADLVVTIGLGLEAGLETVLASAEADGVEVLELAPLVEPLPFAAAESGGLDPHFWMDPIRVGTAATAIAEALTRSEGEGPWAENAAGYATEMEQLDGEIAEVLASVPADQRRIVTNHEAFGYFADRYSFEVLGVIIPGGSTLANPSSARLADLVMIMDDGDVRVIFAETSRPADLAEALAAELGDEVEVVELFTESLGEAGSDADSLSDMLLANARRIASALGGSN